MSGRSAPIASASPSGPRRHSAPTFTLDEARAALEPLIGKVWSYCEASATQGRTVTLKVKYADFRQVTRGRTVDAPVASRAAMEAIVSELLERLFPAGESIRLLG